MLVKYNNIIPEDEPPKYQDIFNTNNRNISIIPTFGKIVTIRRTISMKYFEIFHIGIGIYDSDTIKILYANHLKKIYIDTQINILNRALASQYCSYGKQQECQGKAKTINDNKKFQQLAKDSRNVIKMLGRYQKLGGGKGTN